ncbi:hypothetical protein M231_06464 [Tremella mesenterica]|uniref:Uncharacterized protein n=1 Tax=Tremella mesenterica TaxID=5217 RepID=A0A4Q1BG84_TREME|nr:hypothetical protein M231_06464 [Tremella mesenterica]
MSLREDTPKKLKQEWVPNALKDDNVTDGIRNEMDKAASYLPGQGLPRDNLDSGAANHNLGDTGRQGPGVALNALKPSGQQDTGETVKRQTDKLASEIQPNSTKSDKTALRDAATLGNDSGEPSGFTQQVTDAAAGVKDAVVNAFRSDNKE